MISRTEYGDTGGWMLSRPTHLLQNTIEWGKKAVENTVEMKLCLPSCIGIFFKSSEKKIYSSLIF